MDRDQILHRIRTAVGRSAGQPPADPPPVLLRVPERSLEERVRMFCQALGQLGGKSFVAESGEEARRYVASLVAGKRAVASNAPILEELGITSIEGVRAGFTSAKELRQACAEADIGITGADFGLADTGSLVFLASSQEPRIVSLLPPVHVAVLQRQRLLANLDELFLTAPGFPEQTSSLVIITGPSRTADIEQILVRGVHGPGQIHVVLV